MAFRRPKVSILDLLLVGGLVAFVAVAISPNFIRARHRVGPDRLCRMNLKQLDYKLHLYYQEHGQYPESLKLFYDEPNSYLNGCLELVPEPVFGSTERNYRVDTYSPGYFNKPMTSWYCPSSEAHPQSERHECWSEVWSANEEQPDLPPNCPLSGQPLLGKMQEGFELLCPAEHQRGFYYGVTSTAGLTMKRECPAVLVER